MIKNDMISSVVPMRQLPHSCTGKYFWNSTLVNGKAGHAWNEQAGLCWIGGNVKTWIASQRELNSLFKLVHFFFGQKQNRDQLVKK